MKDNPKGSEIPTLLQTLIQLLEAHRAAFKQARPYWRGVGLVLAELFNFGRHTLAQAILSLGKLREIGVGGIACIVEEAETESLFENPRHPYTQALLAAITVAEKAARRERIVLSGTVPSPNNPPAGCPFHTRCFAKKGPECVQKHPPEFEVEGHRVACWLVE